MRFDAFVPGDPPTWTAQQKGVSFRRRIVYTKAHIAAEKRRLARHLVGQVPATPLPGPLFVQVKVVYPLTMAQAEQYTEFLADDEFELLHSVEPDADNAVKLLLDVLTTLRFWGDDAQICDLHVRKRYGARPGIRIAAEIVEGHGATPVDLG